MMKITTKTLTRSALILALAIAVQSIKMPQFVTGPLINALLFLAVALVNPISGVLIGLFTPLLAFTFGIMPLAPAVPVIMLGNGLLAAVYGLFSRKPVFGVGIASLAKYMMMTVSVYYLFPGLLKITFPQKVIVMLTTPQFFTALGGGVLALLVLKAMDWQKLNR